MHHAFVQCVTLFVCGFLVSSFLVAGAKRGRRRGERLMPKLSPPMEQLSKFALWQGDAMARAALASERLATCEESPWPRRADLLCRAAYEAAMIRTRCLGPSREFNDDIEATMTDQTVQWCAQKMGFLPVREK